MRHSPSSFARPGSPGRFQRAVARALLAVFLTTLPGSPPARADFSGDRVVAGDASVEQRGNFIWIEASDGTIIQFDLLNVWSYEELHARLPDADSSILLEVLQGPTHVDGGLFSNGTIYLLNPAGIFFGSEAVVDVEGLVAAAGTLSHEDFLAGVDRFELSGVVENAGRIEAPRVALLGTVVANHGDIVAPDGTIALVVGERALLTRPGGHLHVEVDGAAGGPEAPAIQHTGSADAGRGQVSFTTGDVWSVAINHEGITRGRAVELRAESGTVRVSGRIEARGERLGSTGGDVSVTGERVALVGAGIDASGLAGGGRIRVGGDRRGEGALPNARRTFVDEDSVLRADGILRGDGGEVVVWGDEAAAFHGSISARGGVLAGRGGFAEISSGGALWSSGEVDLRAPRGATGTLLYDPQDIEIVGGAGDGSDDPDADPGQVVGDELGQVLFADVGDGTTPFQIHESEIEGTNANVVLEATNSIASTGDFTHDASGEGTGVLRIIDGNDLTLRTRNDPGDADGSAATPGIDLTGLDIRTGSGGSVALETGDGAITVGGIDTSGADGASGGDAGSIEIIAGDADASATSDIVTGALVARGGAGTSGAGGAGGDVTVVSEGVEQELVEGRPETTDLVGGGAVGVASVDTRGGGSDGSAGGAGGLIGIATVDGTITTGSLDASGGGNAAGDGAAGTDGGAGGQILVRAIDSDQDGQNTVTTGALRARGGDGAAGAGGAGGGIEVASVASNEVQYVDDGGEVVTVKEALGGGDVLVDAILSSGGSGTSGGAAGRVLLAAQGESDDPAGGSRIDAAAGITARGGAGSAGDGGDGGRVNARTQDGDIVLGNVVTRGGAGDTAADDAVGGRGGAVDVFAGTGEDASGDLLLAGNIDSRAGAGEDPEASAPGGVVVLAAAETLEHAGQAGPHVRTSDGADVSFEGREVGAAGRLVVQGGDEGENRLFVTATDRADVETRDVTELFAITARSTTADIDVRREGGGTVFDVSGSGSTLTLNRGDSSSDGANLQVRLENPEEGPDDGTLEIATGSVTTGGNFVVEVHGDLVVGDADGTAIEFVDSVAADPAVPRLLSLRADTDGDGSGALRDAPGGAVGRIDLEAAVGDERPTVLMSAGEGVGEAGDPLVFVGGGNVSVANAPRVANPDGDDASPPFVADAGADTGIFLRNTGSGDLALVRRNVSLEGAVVGAGSGDIAITNEAGDLIVEGRVSALPPDSPFDPDTDPEGPGGDVLLSAPGGNIVLSTVDVVESGGEQVFATPVTLQRNAALLALGGVDFQDTVDTVANAFSEASLDATFEGTARFGGAVGSQRALSRLGLAENAEDAGTVLVETDTLRTVGAQTFEADVEVGGAVPVTFASVERDVAFQHDLDAAGGATAPAVVEARRVVFGGDVGSGAALPGLSTLAPGGVLFTGEGDQSVTTGDGGTRFDTGAGTTPPPVATVSKLGGGLALASTGAIEMADGQKLSVQGDLAIDAPQVRVTDLSALSVDVESPDLQVFARAGGAVRAPDGGLFRDAGTDIVANTVRFSSAPTVVGAGRTPRVATASGGAEGAGPLPVTRLPAPVAASDLVSPVAPGETLLDLAIPAPDPGHETPEIEGGPVEVPQPLRVGQTAPATPTPEADAVLAWLACADTDGPAARPGCVAPPAAPEGSVLDTPRARELAAEYRALLGDAPEVRAGRDALAAAAARGAALRDADLPEAGRRYLADVARLLARARLLGLDPSAQGRVRADVLAAVRDAIGAPELDVAGLEAAVRASRPGLRI